MQSRLLFIETRSPLHCGVGHARGLVDLPIARETVSGFPMIPSSGLKGALRNAAHDAELEQSSISKLFGPSVKEITQQSHAGELSFGDASLLAIPVKSMNGVFGLVTSPYLLNKLALDIQSMGGTAPQIPNIKAGQALVTDQTILQHSSSDTRVTLTDYTLDSVNEPLVDEWSRLFSEWISRDAYTSQSIQTRFCIVNDDTLRDFVGRSVEVAVRVSLDRETRTAANQALWTEENLPKFSILFSMCYATPNQSGRKPETLYDELSVVVEQAVQIGGNATIGRGRCSISLCEVMSV